MSLIEKVFPTCPVDPLSRDVKHRNVLTMQERLDVIREYRRTPVYQHVAQKFNCSSKQIRNIISKQKAVLDNTARTSVCIHTQVTCGCDRTEKIQFLGKVIYEYLLRSVYHCLPFSERSVCEKALEVKNLMALENFYPTDVWLLNFKTIYHVLDFDIDAMRHTVIFTAPKEASIESRDIIEYIRNYESQVRGHSQPDNSADWKPRQHSIHNHAYTAEPEPEELPEFQVLPILDSTTNQGPPAQRDEANGNAATDEHPRAEVTFTIIHLDGDENGCYAKSNKVETIRSNDLVKSKNNTTNNVSISTVRKAFHHVSDYHRLRAANGGPCHVGPHNQLQSNAMMETSESNLLSPIPEVTNSDVALNYLRAVEEYAMLEGNYRAVGLLAQLATVVKNPPSQSDFQS